MVTGPTTQTLVRSDCRHKDIPPASALTYGQGRGWACYGCGKTLAKDAVLVGRAVGRDGAHVLDCDVYACP